jgi:hypothetical protein
LGWVIELRLDEVHKSSGGPAAGDTIQLFLDAASYWHVVSNLFSRGERWLLFLSRPVSGLERFRGTVLRYEDGRTRAFQYTDAYELAPSMPEEGATRSRSGATKVTSESQSEVASIIEQVRIRGDQSSPTITMSAPATGSVLRGSVSMEASANDDSGVASAQFLLDGATFGQAVPNPAHSPTWSPSILWDTRTSPDGAHTVAALAVDVADNSATSEPVSVLVDNTAPAFVSWGLSPASLWPPNHKLVTVTANINVVDAQGSAPTVRLVSITCNDACDPATDIAGASYGTDDRQFQLKAERNGKEGRVYTVTYSASDKAGNLVSVQPTVTVPHDQGKK